MSTASGSGSRKLSRSASTIVADNAGGYHDFKIDGYSRIKSLPGGESLKSSPFTVGGHRWRIAFFPNGHDDDWEDEEAMSSLRYASLQLVLDEEATEGVLAQYEFAFMAGVLYIKTSTQYPMLIIVSSYGPYVRNHRDSFKFYKSSIVSTRTKIVYMHI
ncbi:hypothetical protein EJB05_22743, partial [Eragrostis curvula]